MTSPASQLAPPTLHWVRASAQGDSCDLCRKPIKPDGDCYVCIRRAFELHDLRYIETAPLNILMCIDCGQKRPYAPVLAPKPSWDAQGQIIVPAPACKQDAPTCAYPQTDQPPARRATDHLHDFSPFLGDPRD